VDLGLLDLEFGEDLVRLIALGGELGPVTPPGRIARSLYQAPAQQRAEMRLRRADGPIWRLVLSLVLLRSCRADSPALSGNR
jgi:hypothetical protein